MNRFTVSTFAVLFITVSATTSFAQGWATPNVFGGYNYSNGVTSQRNVFGGQNYYQNGRPLGTTQPTVGGGWRWW
ncbi:MAG: hypothetical protein LBT05_09945 [Planctomycetaceae bacterium]|jgi:hypothetical protein|nr:hypothetical protein [Planctomycetaceae bacterium]